MRSPNKLLLTIFIFTVMIVILSQAFADQQQITLTVVVYTKDGEELRGAIVEVANQTLTQRDTTDLEGEAQFKINTSDTYVIRVYYPPGHKVYEGQISKYNKSTFRANVSVVSTWTIVVKDGKDRDPVPNANVTIVLSANKSIKYSKLAGSDGRTSFGPIPIGNYIITVKYGSVEKGVTKEPKVEGETVEPLSLTLPLYRVTLIVRDVYDVPVKDVGVELKSELDEEAVAASSTNANGEAVLKLIPNGNYYVVAYLKNIKVYESEEEEIRVLNNDVEKTIKINASRANITIYDYDGEIEIRDYTLRGKLIKDDKTILETDSVEGVLKFNHTPFASYTLKIYLGEIMVYSGTYEVKKETSQGSVKAWFHDIKIEVNASILANETMARSLKVKFDRDPVEVEVQTSEGRAALKNIPRARGYLVTLFYQDKEVGRIQNINVVDEDQLIKLNLTGYRIKFTTFNLDDEPISADIYISLPGGEKILYMKTAPDGSGLSGILLPLPYEISAYLGGIKVGEQKLTLTSDANLLMRLSVINTNFKILDKDGEETMTDIDLKLIHDSLELKGASDESGLIRLKNIPVAQYRLIANYHGFKVLDQLIEIGPDTREVELQAPGVLDAKLVLLDALKKPLDQGSISLTFGNVKISKNISSNGEVVVKNFPNTTISIQAFYKGIRVEVDPAEFDLAGDEMRVTCITSVYLLTVRVLRGDGEPVNEGELLIYVDGQVKARHDLSSGNTFTDRLPRGDANIRVIYRGREAGFMNIYLEQPTNDATIHSTLYPLRIQIYNPEGRPLEGAEIVIKDELGEIERARSGDDGLIEAILPTGSYNASIKIGNNTYHFNLDFRASHSINFLYPVSQNYGFEISVAAGAVNLAISSFALSKISRERPRRAPERRVDRRPRKIPRV